MTGPWRQAETALSLLWRKRAPSGGTPLALIAANLVLALRGTAGGWDARFFLPGVNGLVQAVAVHGAEIYVGGQFTAADNVSVTNIACWDGTNWSALGGGIDGEVRAIAVWGGTVYAGGVFANAGGVTAANIARWDGANWFPLGSGVNGASVEALAVGPDGMLYVGGSFDFVGGLGATNIARWDGAAWQGVGGGVDSTLYPPRVSALVFMGNDLYAGGLFTEAGGISVNHIAKWNGSAWTSLDRGVADPDYPAQITALAVMGNELYAGGSFSLASSRAARNIARWNGVAWSALGDGLGRFFGELPVNALVVSGNSVYAGGRFVTAGGASADNIAVWDGAVWSEVGSGASGRVEALAVYGTNLLIGGMFSVAGQLAPLGVGLWDGLAWSNVGVEGGQGVYGARTCSGTSCVGDAIGALTATGGVVYAGGAFNVAGNALTANVARWSGSNWSPLGNGPDGPVAALAWHNGDLVAGGRFANAGGVMATNMVRWDGANWAAMGSGLNGVVSALAVNGNVLFAGGAFSAAGGVMASNVACWDGANWKGIGGGVNGPVYALAIQGSNLFVGGKFTSAGGVNATNIARWNGTAWSALGAGVSGVANPLVRFRPPPVSALAVHGDDLFVGGDFAFAGGVPATNIARWNGLGWSSVGGGLPGPGALAPPPSVAALLVGDGQLYVGGSFPRTGGLSAGGLAQWDGVNWSVFEGGVTRGVQSLPFVAALAQNGGELCVAGHFKFAGPTPASDFSIWRSRPALRIAGVGDNVRVSWPAAATGYQLQSGENLDPLSWRNATNSPMVVGDQRVITDQRDSSTRFYRLRKQSQTD